MIGVLLGLLIVAAMFALGIPQWVERKSYELTLRILRGRR